MLAPRLRLLPPTNGGLPPKSDARDGQSRRDTLFATPVLVIEDESMIAWMIEDILLTAGFTAIALASTGEQAEALAASGGFGLVISDINLGTGKDGIAAAAAIRGATRLPLVFVTAYADETVRDRLTATVPGAQLLRKPIDEEALLRAVMRALAN